MSGMTSDAPVADLAKRRQQGMKKRILPFAPERVFISRDVADHPTSLRIRSLLRDVEIDIIDSVQALKRPADIGVAKRQMILTSHHGRAFKTCQGMVPENLCCGYRIVDLVSGCPMECSYCILQSYLSNNPITTVYVNLETILEQVSACLDRAPRSFFRIGTGELGDSLALDPITDMARVLISFFAGKRNALLELKTKTAFVDHLLGVEHQGRTVISWSLNRPELIASDERGTASLEERFAAARKAAEVGYGVGFHFDPIMLTQSLKEDVADYLSVIDRMLTAVPAQSIAWVSLGLLRFPADLKEKALGRFPGSRIFTGELVPIGKKYRYPRFLRAALYRPLWKRLCEALPAQKIYLCMETPQLWEQIDPSVTSNACIEKRLCHTEIL